MTLPKPPVSKTTRNIILGTGVIVLSIVGALGWIKCQDDRVKAKAQEMLSLYQANPSVPDTKPFEAFHREGLSLATSILMTRAEKAGDVAGRDRLFTEAFETFTDVELSTLLVSRRPLYNKDARHERLKGLQGAILNDEAKSTALALSASSTIPEPLQAKMQACSELLDQKYAIRDGKAPVLRMARDSVFSVRSCKS